MRTSTAQTPSEVEQQRRVCRQRRQFPKENDAIEYVVRRRQQGALAGGRVYRCDHCRKFHITTTPPPGQPRSPQ